MVVVREELTEVLILQFIKALHFRQSPQNELVLTSITEYHVYFSHQLKFPFLIYIRSTDVGMSFIMPSAKHTC